MLLLMELKHHLANFISNESSTAASLKKGDFLVLTAATGGAETYIVSGADGSVAGNYTQVESGLTSAEIVAHLSGGTELIIANGTISFNGDTDDVSEGSTNLYYTDARFNSAFGAKSTSDLSEGSNLYYTDARSRMQLFLLNQVDVYCMLLLQVNLEYLLVIQAAFLLQVLCCTI